MRFKGGGRRRVKNEREEKAKRGRKCKIEIERERNCVVHSEKKHFPFTLNGSIVIFLSYTFINAR